MREHDEARVRNYELAGLISYAHHDPKKMPKFKASEDQRSEKDEAVAQERVRGYFMALALNSGKP